MMKTRWIVLIAAVVACSGHDPDSRDSSRVDTVVVPAALPVDDGVPRLEPRDEANPSFREFRERTLAALQRRHTTYLHGIIAPEIRTSFGADGGAASFREMWKTADGASTIWATLTRVLQMGGGGGGGGKHSSDSMFYAPYVYAFWPDSIDAFSHVAVTGANVGLRTEPSSSAPLLGTATYSILRSVDWTTTPGDVVPSDTSWVRVETPDKRSGWIRVADAYSPVSWRAAFARRGDRWVMILFVAGD